EGVFAVEAERLLVVGGHAADDEGDQRHVPHDHVLAGTVGHGYLPDHEHAACPGGATGGMCANQRALGPSCSAARLSAAADPWLCALASRRVCPFATFRTGSGPPGRRVPGSFRCAP